MLREAAGHLHQQHVADAVAPCVVDLLEIVEIDVNHRPHLRGFLSHMQRMLHAVEQHAPVGQTGQPIEIGQLMGARLGLLALGDVT